MKKSIRVVVIVTFIFLLSGTAMCWWPSFQRKMTTASEFSLKNLEGKTISLSDFDNQNVILFFWTTWCPHCRTQLVELNKKHKDIAAADIALISIDIGEPERRVKSFVEKYSLAYPVLLDYNRTIAGQYGVRGIPTLVFISKDRTILGVVHSLPSNYKQYFSDNGS